MAEKKKSIIEEALLEAKSLEDALKANTKEMLSAHLSREIESIVESSLKEEDEEELDDIDLEGSDDEEEVELDLDNEEESEEDDVELDLDDEEESEGETADLDLDVDLDFDAGEETEDDEEELDFDVSSMRDDGEEVLDLTNASDEEVIHVFKNKLGDNDEVEVVKNDAGIHLKDNETGVEYFIKESMDRFGMEEGEYCSECGSGSMYEDSLGEETIYEITLDGPEMGRMYDEEDGEDESWWDTPEGIELGNRPISDFDHILNRDVEEGAYIDEEEIMEDKLQRHRRTAGKQRYHGSRLAARESKNVRKPLLSNKPKTNAVSESKIIKEYEELKTKNEEYKKALNVFKDKLNEVALFNTNLAYVNRLFTEHSTTKNEKMGILKRFDNAETIKESKNIYKTIKVELDNKKPINESIENKVNKTVKSYNSNNLNESTAYVDPQITAIKDLMRRIS